jgi:hypothetical protein
MTWSGGSQCGHSLTARENIYTLQTPPLCAAVGKTRVEELYHSVVIRDTIGFRWSSVCAVTWWQ